MRIGTIALAAAGAAAAVIAGERLVRGLRARGDMQGAVVAIAGGTRGLGLALAREFGLRGARIAICGRDGKHLERACDELSIEGIEVFCLDCDVRDRDDVERFVAATVAHFGAIDVLVNDAGTIAVGPMDSMTEADYREAMDTHFWGVYYAVEAALPYMRERGSGSIVNIASIGGLISVPHLLPYSASKFALVGYSLGLAAELRAAGIAVTTVCPGLMRTGSPPNASFKGQNQREYAWFSTLDTLPIVSVSARAAARRIADATAARERLVVVGLTAQAAYAAQRAVPAAVAACNAIAARLLPKPGGIGERRATGWQSISGVTPSPLAAEMQAAATEYNQD